MIESGLRSYLLQQPAITALVSNRVYPLRLPQDATFPAVTYQRIAGSESITHDGRSGLATARMQIDCWDEGDYGYGDVLTLADAVKAALSGYRGTWGTDRVAAVTVINDLDVAEPEPELWRRMVEIALLHEVRA